MTYEESRAFFALVDGETKLEGPHGWIQWKGTNVCIDLRCTCGSLLHFDGEFFYSFECLDCGRVYAVGQYVKLVEITDEAMKAGTRASPCHHKLKDE